MTKADIINRIADKTGVPKVDVLVTMEAFFKEVKASLEEGETGACKGIWLFLAKTQGSENCPQHPAEYGGAYTRAYYPIV